MSQYVTSIWGTITRREMLRRAVHAGFLLPLQKSKPAAAVQAPTANLTTTGQAFREFSTEPLLWQDSKRKPEILVHTGKLFDKDGLPYTPKKTRDSSWLYKPGGATGKSIYQYTNTQAVNCAQAPFPDHRGANNMEPALFPNYHVHQIQPEHL